jgi:septum formation protein
MAMTLWIDSQPLVLASKSQARRNILAGAGVPTEIVPSAIDERAEEQRAGATSGEAAARLLALAKARAVSAQMPGRAVLGADQTLSLGTKRFSKPTDRAAARAQLRELSGQTHQLYSALALVRDGAVLFEHGEAAHLTMRTLSNDFIARYLDAAGEAALGSVGGYQIEGAGAHLFERVAGDYFTVMGLPLLPLLDFLRQSGLMAG